MQRLPALPQRGLDQHDLDGALAGHVLVERRGADPQLAGHRAHGEAAGPVPLEDEPRRGHHLVRPAHRYAAAGPAGSRRNTGWRGAMAASSSSDESAETPSKNTPTSSFQRFR